jgi:hypothetical protein
MLTLHDRSGLPFLIAGVAVVLALAPSAFATTIYSVTGPPAGTGELGGSFEVVIEVGWTAASAYTNVSISAQVGGLPPDSITAYLTTAIGATATSATEVTTPFTFSPATDDESDTLFSGLSLPAGTYFLVLYGSFTGTQGWVSTTSPTVMTDTRVNANPAHVASEGNGSPDNVYPPGSTFATIIENNLIFTVTGSSVPEPSSMVLALSGLAGLLIARYKKRSAVSDAPAAK